MESENKLLPILREGIDVVKMVLFRKLKTDFSVRYAENGPEFVSRLTGAVLNDLFGTVNRAEPFASFADAQQNAIAFEVRNIPALHGELLPILTDALRIQFLCDAQEGVDDSTVLEHALTVGVLISEREVPLPAPFIDSVRKLGMTAHLTD